MKTILNILLYLWQLPQHIVALVLEGILCLSAKRVKFTDRNIIIKWEGIGGSMSLGKYIFTDNPNRERTIKHESGHSIQSLYLGPLYLLVIGIPSILHACIHTICGYFGITWDYYKFYTEAWANKLGGVK